MAREIPDALKSGSRTGNGTINHTAHGKQAGALKLPGMIRMLGEGVCKLLLTLDPRQVRNSFINSNAFHISAAHREILLTAGGKEFTRCVGHINNMLMIVSDMT